MPADFSEYVDLTPFDLSAGDIYRDAISMARLTLPEFNLRVGTPEDAIFQAASYISALNVAAINRLPDRLMAGILLMMGVQRQDGFPAEISVVFTADSYDGATIPLGTTVSFEATFEDEIQEYVFVTTEVGEIQPVTSPGPGDPFPTIEISAQCTNPGLIPIVSAGDDLTILTSGTSLLSAEVGSNFVNGIDPDTDSEYLARCVSYLNSLSSTLAKSTQVDSHVSSTYPGVVYKTKTYDLTNGDENLGDISVYRSASPSYYGGNGTLVQINFPEDHQFIVGDKIYVQGLNSTLNSPSTALTSLYTVTQTTATSIKFSLGYSASAAVATSSAAVIAADDQPGYATVFVYGNNENISSADKTKILIDLTNKSVAGLSYKIRDPEIVTLEISAEVVLSEDYDQEPLQETIKYAIVDYLSPLGFPYSEDRVRQTSIISLIASVPGVLYVKSVTVTPTGDGWLPQIDSDAQFAYKGSLPSIAIDDISITFTTQ
jgi:uncharacterized phage protein gp47/JayE